MIKSVMRFRPTRAVLVVLLAVFALLVAPLAASAEPAIPDSQSSSSSAVPEPTRTESSRTAEPTPTESKTTNVAPSPTTPSPSTSVEAKPTPASPTDVKAVAQGTSAKITWQQPSTGAPERYIVTSSPGKLECTQEPATPSPNCTVTGLATGTSYTFTVVAQNGSFPLKKTSDPSAPSNAITPTGAPTAPGDVKATPGDQQATVTWTKPTSDGGSAITSYLVATTSGTGVCSVDGATTTCNATGLTNGVPYSFVVKATNDDGFVSPDSKASGPVVPTTKPSAPTDVQAVAGMASATVTWKAPTQTGGTPIKSYAVSSQVVGGDGGNGDLGKACDPTATSCVVTGLKNGTKYEFTVTATNDAGLVSPASAPSDPVIAGEVPPDAPTNVVGTSTKGGGGVNVTWTAPANSGSSRLEKYVVTGYQNNVAVPGATCTVTRGLVYLDTYCTISGLTNGSAYTFDVVAWNKQSASNPSSASAPVTPLGPPAAPTEVVAAAGDASALVSWTAPPDAGSPVTGYTVYASPGSAKCSPNPVATSCVVEGLTNGKPFTFVVEATNSAGTGPESAPSAPMTPIGPPSPPLAVTASAPNNTTVSAGWKSPKSTGGAPVKTYTATAYTGTDPAGQCFATALQNTCDIQNLTSGTTYTVRVLATNAAGPSGLSDASDPVTPGQSNPGSPTDVTATAGDGQIEAKWAAPGSAGKSKINQYVATATPTADGSAPRAATPATCTTTGKVVKPATNCKITGLVDGTAYQVTVVASNASGSSDPSSPSQAVTPSGPPSEPVNIVADPGNTELTINWDPPGSTGGSAITGYVATAETGAWPSRRSFTCETTTDTNCKVTGLTNGSSYAISVKVTNQAGKSATGTGPAATPFGVPGAPASASGQSADKAVIVSWTKPKDDGGSPVTGYSVVASPGGGTCSTGGSALTCTVGGLDDGTAYTFAVTASNAAGFGPATTTKSVTPAQILADPPTNVTAVPGNATAEVSWDKPGNVGKGILLRYEVQVAGGQPDAAQQCKTVTSLEHKCKVSGLTNGTAYQFQARTVTTKGASDWSEASAPVTPGGPPGPATNVSGKPGDSQVEVDWTAPESTGGSAITSYTVTTTSAGLEVSAKKPTCSVDAPGTSCTVTGLTNGKAYEFIVTTRTQAGGSSTSAPSAPITPFGPLEAPTKLVGKGGNGTASLSWRAPSQTGGTPIANYTVSSSPESAGCTTGGSTLECTVQGLTNHTEYTFTVTATNSSDPAQTSAPSNQVKVTPGKLQPDAPTDLVGVGGNREVKVSWTAPAAGGPIARTVVTASPGDRTCTAYLLETSCSVRGLTNGQGYTFTAKATNVLAQTSPESQPSAVVVPAVAPSPPTSPSAVAGDATIQVAWAAPTSDGGSPITNYVATATAGKSSLTCSTVDTECTITGAVNGTAYKVSIVAINAAGTSKPAKVSGSVTPLGPPSPPLNLDATAGRGDAVITWDASANTGGKKIDSYTVTAHASEAGNGLTQSCTTKRFGLIAPGRKCTIGGLNPGTTYTFTAVAENVIGTSQSSLPSNPVTIGSTVPGEPLDVAASSDKAQEALVTWKPPASSGGAAVTGYEVTSSPGGLTCKPLTVFYHSCTVKGLTNGTPYTFTVTAKNKYGIGPASSPTNSVTPKGAPTAPQNVKGAAGDATITASWTAPTSDGGSAITGYTAWLTGYLGERHGSCSTDGAGTTCAINGLENGKQYRVHVTATNGIVGPAGIDSTWVVPGGKPTAPRDVVAKAGEQSAQVTWAAPTNDGGSAVTEYTVTSANEKGSPNGSCSTKKGILGIAKKCLVGGLTNGTPYTFVVVATNALGAGPQSDPSTPVTPGNKVPSAPTNAKATVGNKQATISWSPPTDQGGAPVTKYKVTASAGLVKPSCQAAAPTLSCVVTGLQNGKSYSFDVVAVNSFGNSPAAVTTAVTPGGVPGPILPIQIGGTAYSKTSAWVWWGFPDNDGGSPVTSYTATASPGGQSCTSTAAKPGADPNNFCFINDLAAGSYSITVYATNANGNGDPSTGPTPITIKGLPGAPTNVVAKLSGTTATLSWNAPSATAGSAIAHYNVIPNGSSGTTATCSTVQAPATTCTIPGLAVGSQSSWAVVAVNAEGSASAQSSWSNVVTPSDGGGGQPDPRVASTSTVKKLTRTRYRITIRASATGEAIPTIARVRANNRGGWKNVPLNAAGVGRTDVRLDKKHNVVKVVVQGAPTQVLRIRRR